MPLPLLIGKQPDAIADQFSTAHWCGAMVLLALIVLHLSGAAFHGLLRRDGVGRRMM